MPISIRQRRQVLFPEVDSPSKRDVNSRRSSQSSAALLSESVYDETWVATIKLANESLTLLSGDDIVKESIAESPRSKERVDRLAQELKRRASAAADPKDSRDFAFLIDIISPRCLSPPVFFTRNSAKSQSMRTVFPLAQDDEQWKHWTRGELGDDETPEPLSSKEARLWNEMYSSLVTSRSERSSKTANQEARAAIPPTQPVVESQDINMVVDPILPTPQTNTEPPSFDISSSMSFDPPVTSTPKAEPKQHPTPPNPPHPPSSPIPSIPSTPSRPRAVSYRSHVSMTPATQRPDPATVARIPTLNDLMRSQSEAKKRQRLEIRKRKRLSTLDASQTHTETQSQSQIDFQLQSQEVVPITPVHSERQQIASDMSLEVDRIIQPKFNSPANTQLSSPPLTPQMNTDDTPTTAKRKKFGSVIEGLGLGAFSSQYDMESNIDDISKFLRDDVDDIFV